MAVTPWQRSCELKPSATGQGLVSVPRESARLGRAPPGNSLTGGTEPRRCPPPLSTLTHPQHHHRLHRCCRCTCTQIFHSFNTEKRCLFSTHCSTILLCKVLFCFVFAKHAAEKKNTPKQKKKKIPPINVFQMPKIKEHVLCGCFVFGVVPPTCLQPAWRRCTLRGFASRCNPRKTSRGSAPPSLGPS